MSVISKISNINRVRANMERRRSNAAGFHGANSATPRGTSRDNAIIANLAEWGFDDAHPDASIYILRNN